MKLCWSVFAVLIMTSSALAAPKERIAEVEFSVNLNAPADAKQVRLWIPYPQTDENQVISGFSVVGSQSVIYVTQDKEFGSGIIYGEWDGSEKEKNLKYSFKVKRKEIVAGKFPEKEAPLNKGEFEKYLRATSLGPLSGKVGETAESITVGKKTTLEKARAIHDWIVKNMYRDPNIKGCGTGDVEKLLVSLGGKCSDIHSVFVALTRSAGIPAREVFGIRIPAGKGGDVTKAQHCWAEFYLPGYGWVAVDPADVRKAMLEKKVSDPKDVREVVEYYFGNVDANRIALGYGRDIVLEPPQKGGPLNYFMYPYAEADGKILNEDLYGFNLGYKITFKE